MNNSNLDLLNLCMEDDLFCALYDALCYFRKEWHTASPVDLWVMALKARKQLYGAKRPDLILPQLFTDLPLHEALLVESLLLWILFTEDQNTNNTPLREAVGRMVSAHGEKWNTVFAEFRKSEDRNEQKGYGIVQHDYYSKEIPMSVGEDTPTCENNVVHDLVSEALDTHDPDSCRALYYILSRVDYQKGHVYENEVRRLSGMTDGIEKMAHEPRKIEAHNHYAKDSCRFEAGSTMNGDVRLPNKI